MTDETLDLIAQIFPRLPAAAVRELRREARLAKYDAQIVLCHEGEVEHCFYIVLYGTVDVYKILEGQRLLVNQLTKGAHFGDIALLLDVPRTATIITAEPTQLLEIDRKIFTRLMTSNPDIVVMGEQLHGYGGYGVLRHFKDASIGIKKALPKVKIILGGLWYSAMPVPTLEEIPKAGAVG